QEVNLSFMLMIDVITFFIALVPLLMIHIPSVVNQHLEKKPSFIEDFKEGFNILKSIPGLLILIGLAMLLNFLLRPITTLMTYFIHNVHGGSSLEYGFISACIQGGMILGAIATSVKKEWNNKMRWIFIGILSSMVAYGAFALAPHGYFIWLAISGAAFMFFIPIINSLYMTIIQITVPNDKIGRVSSIDTALSSLISPIGVILSGPLGELFGVGNLFLYCALIGFSVTLVTYIFSGVKHVNYDTLKDHLKSEESEPEILV
ncbi:MAG: MFS transporter, partial [Candidatus Lokiarchaeota archaeon]